MRRSTHAAEVTVVPASDSGSERARGRTPEELETQVGFLEDEIGDLRRRLAESPVHSRALEQRLAETQRSLAAVTAQNERLAQTLREARDQIVTLKEEVDRLAQPPAGFGIFLARNDDDSIDVFTGGRKLRVNVSPTVDLDDLRKGQEVMLNEALNVVAAMEFEQVGEVVMLKEILADGERVLVIANADEERVVRLADPLREQTLRAGDSLLLDARSGYVYERVPKSEVEELVLEEVPDIDYENIGGLKGQIEQIRDAVELPYLHPDLFKEHELKPPKGVLLYGPPGCGKTLIAKAVANSLAKKVAAKTGQEGKSYFLNIKGPELLNKYVGETERHIRLVFQRAREKASEGTPVIVFFDEMDSLFRTRGSGVSSDVENTIVPQLLSEIDGVEGLENVIVIGASNREDMIDPAILRPGRLDVKIKIERPDAEAARDIFSKYLTRRAAAARRRPRRVRQRPRRLRGRDDPGHRRADVHRDRGEPLPRGHLRQRRQGGPVLQGLQLRRDDPEHRRPGQEDGDQGPARHRAEGHPGHPPAPGLRRRVQGERGPAQHHEPRRLGPHLRQEGRADRVHPHAHHRQAGHRAGPVHRHGLQHRPVPLDSRLVDEGEKVERQEVEAFLETRRELGPAYEREIVDAFAERIERAVAVQAGERVEDVRRRRDDERGDRQRQLALGIVSVVAGIPITVPLAVTDSVAALVVSWLGIVGVNAAHAAAINGRRARPDR